jgi:hypothetical protein
MQNFHSRRVSTQEVFPAPGTAAGTSFDDWRVGEMKNIFAQIVKVDQRSRTVYGRAVQEIPDKSGEMFDYDTSKPQFQAWSAEVSNDTDGASLGNVRSMHGNVCAGKLTDIQFDDHEKAIDVTAKIVDDNEWQKVQEGCYTGFSIGGRYIKRWPDVIDGKAVTRYTAEPSEISLVDKPCVPTAKFFEIRKRDGSTSRIAFKSDTDLSLEEITMFTPSPDDREGRHSVLKAIKAAVPRDLLEKISDRRRAVQKLAWQVVDGLHKAGIRVPPSLDFEIEEKPFRQANGVMSNSAEVVGKCGVRPSESFRGGHLYKASTLPPQSSNSWTPNDALADDGAMLADTAVQADARQPLGTPVPTMGAPPHSASISNPTPGPQDLDLATKAVALDLQRQKPWF